MKDAMANCESCGRKIVWATCDMTGQRIPLDWVRVRTYEVERTETGRVSAGLRLGEDLQPLLVYVSHFTTCPHPERFSGRNASRTVGRRG